MKIIQFQIFKPWPTIDKVIYGLGDDGIVYWYDSMKRRWIPMTSCKVDTEVVP